MSTPFDIEEILKKNLPQISLPAKIENSITFEGRSETPEERASRLRQDEWKTKVKLGKEIAVSLAALVVGGIVIFACLNIILWNPNASADDKKWATALIASIASGFIGYLTGKASQ